MTPWTVAHWAPCSWNSPSKNPGVGCYPILQGIFPTQGSNLQVSCVSLHWQVASLPLSHLGNPCVDILGCIVLHRSWRFVFFFVFFFLQIKNCGSSLKPLVPLVSLLVTFFQQYLFTLSLCVSHCGNSHSVSNFSTIFVTVSVVSDV